MVIRRRGDRLQVADRLDPLSSKVFVDERPSLGFAVEFRLGETSSRLAENLIGSLQLLESFLFGKVAPSLF